MHTPLLRGKVTNKYRDYKVKIQKKKKMLKRLSTLVER